MAPTVVELFAGCGGLALGLEKAGFETAMLLEYDKDCAATLRQNRPGWNVVESDIQDADFKGIRADLVSGGFPCQPFSHAGHKLGFSDTRGTLFYEFARAIKEIKPKMFLAENVEAILRNDGGKTLDSIMNILRSLGYDVQYKVLNALNYNVPQKRKRVFFIGHKRSYKKAEFEYPKPNNKVITLRDALKKVPKSEGAKYPKTRAKIFDLVPPGGSWVDLPLRLQKKYMGDHIYAEGGKRGMARRMSWNEPCLTLLCSPSQKMTDRIHPVATRPFTVREYARIQTFPDTWKFAGGMASQYKQIGNAVPVRLARAMGTELRRSLDPEKIKLVAKH